MSKRIPILNLPPGTQYALEIRATNNEGDASEFSNRFVFTTNATSLAPAVPANVGWVVNKDSFAATWDAVLLDGDGTLLNDFSHYQMEFGASGKPNYLYTTSSPNYTFDFSKNSAVFGTPQATVTFRVRSVDISGNMSAWSATLSATNPAPSPPTSLSATAGIEQIHLSWVGSDDLDKQGYRVYASQVSGFTPSLANLRTTTSSTTFTFPTTSSSPWYFKVATYDAFGTNSTYADATATAFAGYVVDDTPPAVPTAFTVTPAFDTAKQRAYFDIEWVSGGSSNLSEHIIGYGVNTTNMEYVSVPGDQTKTRIYTASGTPYYVNIRAESFSGSRSAFVLNSPYPESSIADTTAPATVTGVSASGAFRTLMVTWTQNTENDIKEYDVQIDTATSFATGNLKTVKSQSTVETFTNLVSGSTYYARVRAIDNTGNTSGWSTVASTSVGSLLTDADVAGKIIELNTSIDSSVNLVNNTSRTGTTARWNTTIGTISAVTEDFNGTNIKAMKFSSVGNASNISQSFEVDVSKAYEVSFWLKDTALVSPSTSQIYLGLTGTNFDGTTASFESVNSVGTVGAPSTNFYFTYATNPPVNGWVEIVCYLLPVGTVGTDAAGLGRFPASYQLNVNARMQPNLKNVSLRYLNWGNGTTSRDIYAAHMSVRPVGMESLRIGGANKSVINSWTKTGSVLIDGGAIYADSISSLQIGANAITANEIAAGAITVGSAAIVDGAITRAKIADLAVDNAKIADATITTAKIISLSADKLTAGSGIINDLIIGRAADSNGSLSSFGFIPLTGPGTPTGWRLNKAGLEVNTGSIAGRALAIQDGNNMLPPQYADFESPSTYYDNNLLTENLTRFWDSIGPKFGRQYLNVTIPALSGMNYGRLYLSQTSGDSNLDVESGKTYIFSGYFRNPGSVATTIQLNAMWNTATNTEGTAATFAIPAGTTSWTRFSVPLTAPALVQGAVAYIKVVTQTMAAGFDVDGLQFELKTSDVSTAPSAWRPPSTTSIDGGIIKTGTVGAEQIHADYAKIIRIDADQIDTGYLTSTVTVSGSLIATGLLKRSDVSSITVVTNVATATTTEPHKFNVGHTVTIDGMGTIHDGEHVVTAAPTDTTFRYDITTANATVTAPGSASYLPPGSVGMYPEGLRGTQPDKITGDEEITFYIPTDPTETAIFKGKVIADSITVVQGLEIQGAQSVMTPQSKLILQGSIQAPISAPTLSAASYVMPWPKITSTGTIIPSQRGIGAHSNGAGYYRSLLYSVGDTALDAQYVNTAGVAGTFYNQAFYRGTRTGGSGWTGPYYWPIRDVSGMRYFANGKHRYMFSVYETGYSATKWYFGENNRTTGDSGSYPHGAEYYGRPACGPYNATDSLIAGTDPDKTTLRVRRVNNTGSVISTWTAPALGGLNSAHINSVCYEDWGGGLRIWIAAGTTINAYTTSGSSLVRDTALSFTTDQSTYAGGVFNMAGTIYSQHQASVRQYRYSNLNIDGTQSSINLAYAYYASGGSIQTTLSPSKSINILKRRFLTISGTPPVPGTSGLNFYATIGPVAPDTAVVDDGSGTGATVPVNPTGYASYKLQGATVGTTLTLDGVTNTTASPAITNGFGAGTPAVISSEKGGFTLRGDGTGSWPLMAENQQPAWTNITLVSGYTPNAAFGYSPQYRRWSNGRVELRGCIAKTTGAFNTSGTVITAALPANCRPTETVFCNAAATQTGGMNNMRLDVGATGIITAATYSTTQTWVSLDGWYWYV